MSDDGGENIGKGVRLLLLGHNVNTIIAKKTVHFSSSMIEGFFRMLKNMYINKHKNYRVSKMYNLLSRGINCYNEMPLSSIDGARPSELFSGEIDRLGLVQNLKKQTKMARGRRPEINKGCFNDHLIAST